MITPLYDVTGVEILGHCRLRLTFSDGLVGDAGLSGLRDWGGVFAPLRDPDTFAQVRVDPETGTITWLTARTSRRKFSTSEHQRTPGRPRTGSPQPATVHPHMPTDNLAGRRPHDGEHGAGSRTL